MRVVLFMGVVLFSTILLSRAASVGDSCDEWSLRDAMRMGGTVTFGCDGKILLSQTIAVTNDAVIDGSGHQVTISGNNSVRIFSVASGVSLTLINLTIADGRQIGTNGISSAPNGEPVSGAAIYNSQGTVWLASCTISNNVASGGRGTSGSGGVGNGGTAFGGAIFNDRGTLQVSNCVFFANSVMGGTAGGGVINFGGLAGEGAGGAICNQQGEMNLVATTLSFNSATGGLGGGVVGNGFFGSAANGSGGALHSSTGFVSVVDCSFHDNRAVGNDLPWNGPLTGKGLGGAVSIVSGLAVVSGTIFSNNLALGGAKLRQGTAGEGRGGAIMAAGTMTVTACIFARNSATTGPAGAAGGSGNGGAIYAGAWSEIVGSTFISNLAVGGNAVSVGGLPAPGGPGFGGAVYGTANPRITNCTFAKNISQGGRGADFGGGAGGLAAGGGVYGILATGVLVNVTIAGNAAVGGGGVPTGMAAGGGIAVTNGSVSIGNTIVAYSTSGSNCFGSIVDLGGNVSSDGSCNFSSGLNNVDPLLGPLGNYGGTTPTIPLLEGSPAIDGGVDDLGPGSEIIPRTDQRGHRRPFGTHVDSGAFESSPPFLIRGRVRRYLEPGLRVTAGGLSAAVQANGDYSIEGLPSGFPTVTLEGSGSVSVPQSQSMVVGPDRLNVDFDAYLLNGFWIEKTNDTLRIVFAGEAGQKERVDSSLDLQNWTPYSTNSVGPNRFFEFYLPSPAGGESKAFRGVRVQ